MKKCQIFKHLSISIFSIAMANAQVPEKEKVFKPSLNGDYTARYFKLKSDENKFNVDKIQGALTLDLGLKVGRNFSTHGVLVQTPALGKRFYTIYDFNKKDDSPVVFDKDHASILPSTFFLQKLYAQWETDMTKIQVGTIPRAELSSKFKKDHNSKTGTVENGFMGSNAWVDGVRVSQSLSKDKPSVLLTLTVGALDDLSTSFNKRKVRNPNYAEAQIDWGNCKGLIAEGSVGIVDKDVFVRTGLEDFIKVTNDITVKVYGEGLYNVTEGEVAGILGYQTDLLKAFNPKLGDKVMVGMEIAYLDPKIGTRGTMANDAFLAGSRFRIQLSGKIDKKGNVSWFAQKDMGTNNLVNIGTKITFKK